MTRYTPDQQYRPCSTLRVTQGRHQSRSEGMVGAWSSVVGYLMYDVIWCLLRSISISVLFWLALHEEISHGQLVYILLAI